MGFTGFPISAGDDWTDATYLTQLYAALNERCSFIGVSGFTAPVAGDYAGQASWFADAQNWIETNCTSFIQSHDLSGTPLAANQDGASTLPNWTLANLRTAGGLNASGFTRNPLGGGVAYGIAMATDYVIPELYNQLKTCFTLLKWYGAAGTQGFDLISTRDGGNLSNNATWATVKSEAEGQYLVNSGGGAVLSFCESRGDYDMTFGLQSNLNRASTYTTVSGIFTGFNTALDFYAFAVKPTIGVSQVFDANGDGVIENAYHRFDAGSATNTSSRTSVLLGALDTYPVWCDEPLVVGDDNAKGYEVTDIVCVLRGDVSGGLVYT